MSDLVHNPRQREAIEHVHGPMVVIAGAGTGKTMVLVERVARLIAQSEARPEEILAVTYTDKAAQELQEKLQARVGNPRLRATTFHAFGLAVLKREKQEFRLLDEKDLWILLRRRLDRLGLKYYIKAARPHEFLNALLDFFSRCQDELVDAARFSRYVEELRAGKYTPPRVMKSRKSSPVTLAERLDRCEEIARVFAKVEAMLREENLGTFGDMITRAVHLLRSDPGLLMREQQRVRFLLIDEFQDANVAQIELARLLGGTERNIFAVGDPDQAIFRFRGASSAAFAEFQRCFPGAGSVVLDENQRSTSNILRCAYAIIQRNPAVDCRLPGGAEFKRQALRSARQARAAAEGKPLAPQKLGIVLHQGKEQEAADLAACIEELRSAGYAGSIAVVYRMHSHRDEIARALADREIPFVVKGLDILETAVIRDLLACLGAVASLSDSEALFRVAALPMFGMEGDAVRSSLASSSREASFTSLLQKIPGGARVLAAVERARAFAASVDWNSAQVCAFVIRSFGFAESEVAVRVFREFVDKWHAKPITVSGSLQEFIEYVDLFHEAGGALELPVPETPGAVQLMTVHTAKGLEFNSVFVLRANSGSFPSHYREAVFEFPPELRAMPLTDDSKEIHTQEERRLFYVALTRARDSLSVYARPGTGKDGTPAGLLREMMKSAFAKGCWSQRDARSFSARIQAGATATAGVASWLLMKPRPEILTATLSATSIDAFDTCPLKYKLMRDWRIPGPASAAMLYGKIMHDVLRDLHQAILAGRPRSQGEILQCFRDLIAAAAFDDELQRALFEQQGAKQLIQYAAARAQGPPPPILAVEKTFEMQVDGVRVRGRMDRVDRLDAGRVRVIDFKTGSPFDQEKADKSLQLSIYAIAARKTFDAEPFELAIYNLEDNSEVTTVRDDQELVETRAKIAEVAEGIAAGFFEPKPGFHCRSCGYCNLCPATERTLYTIAAAAPARNSGGSDQLRFFEGDGLQGRP
ncbi:MAG: ATP-dependent helicase [Acidobacteriia bacterium]|nr:ATP-dependent helicase [Terriglobia bacterium]